MLKKYLEITKPGIVRGNLIVAIAAYIYASSNDIDFIKLVALVLGIGLIVGSAAVANNVIDKNIDAKMQRTKKRAVASGVISVQQALVYSTILGLIGIVLLMFYVNMLTAIIGISSFILYVFLYGVTKRSSSYGTLVGALPGAAPPLAGYTAATNQIDWLGGLLFAILVFWQMPHFYAIAMLHLKDYRLAGLPVMPIAKGKLHTKKLTLGYIAAFILCTSLLFGFGHAGYSFIAILTIANTWWAKVAFDGFGDIDDTIWAKSMFKISLLVLILFSTLLALNNYLP